MIKDILTTGLMTIAGAIIGLVGGVVSAVVLGAIVDFVSGMGGVALFGGVMGALTGLIAGADTGVFGIRTRYGLEGVLIIGVAQLLGFWIDDGPWNGKGIYILEGIGTLAGWLIALLVRKLLSKRLSRGSIMAWVLVG